MVQGPVVVGVPRLLTEGVRQLLVEPRMGEGIDLFNQLVGS